MEKRLITISLCMIVKNEEKVLARCLDSVKDLVDEIIIVDTGSTDNTKTIAGNYTDKIYDFAWIDDFAAARNYAFSRATQDYILWLDADDLLLEADREKFLNLKYTFDAAVDSVTMKYHLCFDEYGNLISSSRRSRLVKRANQFRWIGPVHEYLEVYGNILHSEIAVTHQSERHDADRNLRIYKKRLAAGEIFSPRDQYYFANELMDHKCYWDAVQWYEKFLSTGQGWVEDNISACGKLNECYQHLGETENADLAILRSFLHDIPRAEFCCRMGFRFQRMGQFLRAAFWFELAIILEKKGGSRGFVNHAFETWVPHIQLCVCYDRLGNYELAEWHNEMAAKYIPDNPSVLSNREYFKSKNKQE